MEEYTSEELKALLREELNAVVIDTEKIEKINAELASREDQRETNEAWQRFVARY